MQHSELNEAVQVNGNLFTFQLAFAVLLDINEINFAVRKGNEGNHKS